MTAWWEWVSAGLAEREWTEYRLAKTTGIAKGVIALWRTKGSEPEIGSVRQVAEAFDVSAIDAMIAAGYLAPDELPESMSVLEAIRRDRSLDAAGRDALVSVYRAVVTTGSR